MTAGDIRQIFLRFFEEKNHLIVPSAPIVNKDDPTLMFVNAGMNPFKDYFLGHRQPERPRIADTQKCLRVSGKHNDLEEVGRDGYHHTMFEMLGNWSFGDYFKKEAIAWAWELLIGRYGLPQDRIYATVFGGDVTDSLPEDIEARNLWNEWLPADCILPFGRKDNFWEMGDTGPCGPCSEIHIDLRSEADRAAIPGKDLVNVGHPEVIEIWNLVFMQFNRKADGSLESLPAKHVDTGMGFERLVRVIQGKSSNYDSDIFAPLIDFISTSTRITYTGDYSGKSMSDIAMRVMADHVRAVAFGIADGEMPSNTGAGYVLRRILRRAVRYSYSFLHTRQPLIHQLVPILADFFTDIFPDFTSQQDFVARVIEQEELAFLRTLEAGIRRFESLKTPDNVIDGAAAFELYDTYGFPVDLTRLMAAEKGLTLDEAGFEKALADQKKRSRSDAAVATGDWVEVHAVNHDPIFDGYDHDTIDNARLVKYRKVEDKEGTRYQLVLDRTSFYPEGGGQVGDTGKLYFGDEAVEVINAVKENDLPLHITKKLPGQQQASVRTEIDVHRRRLIENNHSATHLLHAALRDVLGDHVQQRGSLLNDKYLRFDFSHFARVTPEELSKIEALVNKRIREDIPRGEFRDLPIHEAKTVGARMLFGEKYGDRVRMITFDQSWSAELCGGCHVPSTGRIGYFKIIGETAVAAGIRRIEAVTADAAEAYINERLAELDAIKQELKNPTDPVKAIRDLTGEIRELKRRITSFEEDRAMQVKSDLINAAKEVNGIRLVSREVDITDAKLLKTLIFQVGKDLGDNAFVLLGSGDDGKAQLMLYISEELVESRKLHAGNIIKELAKAIDGGGGGQAFFASAGGTSPAGLKQAIGKAKDYIS